MTDAITASRTYSDEFLPILGKTLISWKIRKDQVTKKVPKNLSKACACNTSCTPCEGLAAPSTPQWLCHLKEGVV